MFVIPYEKAMMIGRHLVSWARQSTSFAIIHLALISSPLLSSLAADVDVREVMSRVKNASDIDYFT